MAFILFLLSSLLLQGALGKTTIILINIFLTIISKSFHNGIFFSLGEIICEELPVGLCTFSIASSGKRCILENYINHNENMEYQCKTSEIVVKNMNNWIESDECTNACGVDRKSVGISSDSLLEPRFIARLCSRSCYDNCANIVDLYHNLAIGEGKSLNYLYINFSQVISLLIDLNLQVCFSKTCVKFIGRCLVVQ